MPKAKKARNWRRIATIFLFITLVLSIVFVSVQLFFAPDQTSEMGEHTRSEYALMLLQCILGLAVMFLPNVLERRLSIIFPGTMYIMYLVFLYCAIYLGEVRSFYYHIPFWDSILHAFSGAMLGAVGFFVINLLNKDQRITMKMSPLFVSMFALCFAISLGVVWEIYEFTADGLLGLNMQKFAQQDGTPLAGRAALMDTMKDLIIDCLGAFVVVAIGYVSLKKGDAWLARFMPRRRPQPDSTEEESA